jgi:hypothetical protein
MRVMTWAVTKVGLAMQERGSKTAQEIQRETTQEFVQLVNSSDIALMCQEFLRTDTPSVAQIAVIKDTITRDYTAMGNDKVR